jgi:UDP-glucose 4-epimerase
VNIAVTGATGLIGTSVYEHLESLGHKVVRVGRRDICEIKVDFSDPSSVSAADFSGVDSLVHCAGAVDEDFKADPSKAFIQCTLGMDALISRAVECDVKSLAYFSTAHVYGTLKGVVNEDSPPDPISDYAIGHFAAEQIIKRATINTDLKAMILRPNAVFGIPHSSEFDRWWLIPYSFPIGAVRSGKIELRSSGDQKRNFVGTDDLAAYVSAFISSPDKFDDFTILNPLGSENLSIYEFALLCADSHARVTGQNCDVTRPDANPNEVGSDLQYQTIHTIPISMQKLDTFVDQLIRTASDDEMFGEDS